MVTPGSEIDVDKLIRLVRENAPLWDKRDKQYNHRGLRARTWWKVARELGGQTDVVKKRWQGLRDVFRKEYRRYGPGRNEDDVPAGTTSPWVHFEDMYFLTDAINFRKLLGDISPPLTSSPCAPMDCKEEMDFYDEPLTDDEHQQSDNSSPPPLEFRNLESSTTYDSSIKVKLEDSNDYCLGKEEKFETSNPCPPEKEDSDRQFLLSLLPFLKRVPLSRKLVVRHKLQQVLIDVEQNGSMLSEYGDSTQSVRNSS